MNVFVTGGTGDIGGAVVAALVERGHAVTALARSPRSADRLQSAGAEPVAGDIRDPDGWIDSTATADAIIHMASTWAPDMDRTDAEVVECFIDAAASTKRRPGLIYTGGCWLYGPTGDRVANESDPLSAPPMFEAALGTIDRVVTASAVRGIVIHPAMVWEPGGGVFRHFYEDARERSLVRVIGSATTRWPLVHRDDLGLLYALAAESGSGGEQYNAAAEPGVTVGAIAGAVARRFGVPVAAEPRSLGAFIRELGDWAEGYAIDQQMSGEKAMRELGWRPVHRDAVDEIAGNGT